MRNMKKSALIFLCLLFFTAPVYAGEEIEKPDVNAHGACLMDAKSGRVLWGKNENAPLAMASTTKIMTAILALESGKKEETVTVSKRAAFAPKVKMGLSPGEKLRLYDLMQALMLESSNDAAVAIAEHIGGSVENFCARMTAKAKEIGAKDTVFETPNGLDSGEHHSTAYDMAIITRYALGVPGFLDLTNTPEASFKSDSRKYSMTNKNRLLNEYDGANGVKTGYTGRAGHCFVGAARRGDMQLISVVLGSGWGDRGRSQKWIDTKAVLNYGFNNYAYETIVTLGDVAGEMAVTRSRNNSVDYAYSRGLSLPLTEKEKEGLTVSADVPEVMRAPVIKGDKVGTASIKIDGNVFTDIPLVAAEDAARHDLKTSAEKVINAWLEMATKKTPRVILPEA